MVFDTHAVNPFLIPNLGFDTERDFAPIMLIGTAPMIITTHNSRPWQNLREVIAAANEHGMAMVFTGLRHFRH